MAYVAGIDIGSRSTKAVLLDESRQVCGTALVKTRLTSQPLLARQWNRHSRRPVANRMT